MDVRSNLFPQRWSVRVCFCVRVYVYMCVTVSFSLSLSVLSVCTKKRSRVTLKAHPDYKKRTKTVAFFYYFIDPSSYLAFCCSSFLGMLLLYSTV